MATEKVEIDSQGIRRVLKSYKPAQAIAEYVWNGFDAGASTVYIDFGAGDIPSGALGFLRITDNGHGINYSSLKREFKPFYVSQKDVDVEKQKKTLPHGKKGYGRLTFFIFAFKATWRTVFLQDGAKKYFEIEIEAKNLGLYKNSSPLEINKALGTIVEFNNIQLTIFEMSEIEAYLQNEFAFFLELNKDRHFNIVINGQKMVYSLLILDRQVEKIDFTNPDLSFDVTAIQWTDRNSEFSNVYLVKSNGEEVYKTTTKLNKKGDAFLHSVYIRSSYFDKFTIHENETAQPGLGIMNSNRDYAYKVVMERVEKLLRNMRKPYLKNKSGEIIIQLEKEKVFPDYDPKHFLDKYRHDELVIIVKEIYIAEPRLFNDLNVDQKKIFVRFLDTLLASNARESVFKILESIVNLDQDEMIRLSDIISRNTLENIIETVRLIEDRLKVVEDLKQIVFKPELKANEKDHVQAIIENHYWIFGEEYHLVTAEEPDFEEALRRYRFEIYGETDTVGLTSPDKQKEMDIFAIRQNKLSTNIEHIVVELKHPSINLGEKELSQVKRYSRVIVSDDRFNASNMQWRFYLVGNGFTNDKYIEGEIGSHKQNGDDFLVHSVDNVKIYVMKWSEIITSLEIRFNFLLDKLKTKRSDLASQANTAVGVVSETLSLTSVMPPQVSLPKRPRRKINAEYR